METESILSTKVKRFLTSFPSSNKVLQPKDEFLMVITRLRIRLSNGDRFCVSAALSSIIFQTWIRFLLQLPASWSQIIEKIHYEDYAESFLKRPDIAN